MQIENSKVAGATLSRLRLATGARHSALEGRFDAIAELSDPTRRPGVIARYTCLYGPALKALALHLSDIATLEFPHRLRAWEATGMTIPESHDASAFPTPRDHWEALGAMYVIEGSTLGGRMIQRQLARRGIVDNALAFLDPYGKAAGEMWRGLLGVLETEGARSPAAIESICVGAIAGFDHAERVLCGEPQ